MVNVQVPNRHMMTGDLPIQALLGHMNTIARGAGYQASILLFSGCLDAPDSLAAGSTRSLHSTYNTDIMIAGRSVQRGAA